MSRLLGIAVLLAALEPAAQGMEVRGPATQRIAVFERPEVSGDSYAIAGSVACEGVLGEAYLARGVLDPVLALSLLPTAR